MSPSGNSRFLVLTVLSALLFTACGGGGGSSSGGDSNGGDAALQGGDTSSSDRSGQALEHPASNLTSDEDAQHSRGDQTFGAKFVTPPATFNAGLGPIFNANSCDACHTQNGRGQPVFGNGTTGSQAIVRVSSPNGQPEQPGSPGAVPGFGTQVQDHAVFGVSPEASIDLSYATVDGTYGDGTAYQLRQPVLKVNPLGGRSLPSDTLYSLRSAPPVFGLGLLEAIPDSAILANADPDDADGDGISGKANMVWDPELQQTVLGRFGRKANTATVREQAASAYFNDMGVTNSVFNDGTGSTEVDDTTLANTEFYVKTIAVPVRAQLTAQAQTGADLFNSFQCSSCHVPKFQTGDSPITALSNQTIFPYTDLLLHDMGPGLADNRPDFLASGTEWRTPPLWGVGITATILASTANFLHDGRARTLEEAILWHSGEAEKAKESFRNASADQRAALLAFLRSL